MIRLLFVSIAKTRVLLQRVMLILTAAVLIAADCSSTATPAPTPVFYYHNGRVITSGVSHLIFWMPGKTKNDPYIATINQFFLDEATSPDSVDFRGIYTQYCQLKDSPPPCPAAAMYDGGLAIDQNDYPTDRPLGLNFEILLEVARNVPQAQQNSADAYYIFLAPDKSVCWDDSYSGNRYCAKPDCAAFHSSDQRTGLTFALIPYPDTKLCPALNGPSPLDPNNPADLAKYAIADAAHEQADMITNPDGGGWQADINEGEIADICAHKALVSHMWNGHAYWLPQLWSNSDGQCVPGVTISRPFDPAKEKDKRIYPPPTAAVALTSTPTQAATLSPTPSPTPSAASPLPDEFIGTWIGTFNQVLPPVSSYKMTLTLRAGGVGDRIGQATYAACGNTYLTMNDLNPQTQTVITQENTLGRCGSGRMSLRLSGQSLIAEFRTFAGTVGGTATLTRAPTQSTSPTASAIPTVTPHFGLGPNGEASWSAQQTISIPIVVTGPPGANWVLIRPRVRYSNGVVGFTTIEGTLGTRENSGLLLSNLSETSLTITIGGHSCCPPGIPVGAHVTYYISAVNPIRPSTDSPSLYPIVYPGPNASNNPPPCVRLDKDKVVNIAPGDPDRINCPAPNG